MAKRTARPRNDPRTHERTILLEMVGYYGLLGAASVGAWLLH